jgi:flagellar hook-associated protein 1 FlgK
MGSVGTFSGYNIGKSALVATSDAQDVIGNNIANADTEGYTVERLDLVEGPPCLSDGLAEQRTIGQFGMGVAPAAITRARDQYLDNSLRDAFSKQGRHSALESQLSAVQTAVNEPSENGISTAMNRFFNSFNEVENNPESTGVRTAVVGAASLLAQSFQSTRSSVESVKTQLSDTVQSDVNQINTYAKEISELNKQIRKSTSIKQQPNALLDKRDLVLDRLSKLVNISVAVQPSGSVNVSIGGAGLVSDHDVKDVSLISDQGTYEVTMADLIASNNLRGGKLAGDVDALNMGMQYEDKLDALAAELMGQINAIHSTGAGLDGDTGLDLFTGTNARDMAVNSDIVSDVKKLAVAAAPDTEGDQPSPGDASNAVKMYKVKFATISDGDLAGNTIPRYYNSIVSELGTQAANASKLNDACTATVTQLEQQRNSNTTVNIDEEATKMLQYQRCYQAAAKVISASDDMITSVRR